jgi:hypothetical protein
MSALPTIFVSHSHQDDAFGKRIVEDLRARLGQEAVWYDSAGGLHGGDEWWRRIVKEISARDVFLVILSPDALASNWVQREMDIAYRLHVDRRKRLLPVVYRPCQRREDWAIIQEISFAAPRPYAEAFAELLQSLGVTAPAPATTVAAPAAPALPVRASRPISRRAVISTAAGLTGVAALASATWWGLTYVTHGYRAVGALPTATTTLPATAPPTSTPVSGWKARPDLLPTSLKRLGFLGYEIGGVAVIIPPTRRVPAGPFLMGDPSLGFEGEITTSAFEIGTFELTVAEYALAIRAKVVREPVFRDPGTDVTWQAQLATPDHPIVDVTWFDALAYVKWLAGITGQPWRLPTEAEWEKAARGTDGRTYPWGNNWDPSRLNAVGNGGTTPVGAYPSGASPYGAYDMAGNAYEWTSSIAKPYPYKADDGRENLNDTQSMRVLRGGAWDFGLFNAKTWDSQPAYPSSWKLDWGFRIARSVRPAPTNRS